MKIYLAASFKAQEYMRRIAGQIESDGDHKVTSRWIYQGYDEQSVRDGVVVDRVMALRHARQDMRDIRDSNVAALFTGWPSSTGGLHWEYGFCVGIGRQVVLVGPMVNVFMALPSVLERFDSSEQFVKWVLEP